MTCFMHYSYKDCYALVSLNYKVISQMNHKGHNSEITVKSSQWCTSPSCDVYVYLQLFL